MDEFVKVEAKSADASLGTVAMTPGLGGHVLNGRVNKRGKASGECTGCGWSGSSFDSPEELRAAHNKHLEKIAAKMGEFGNG